MGIPPTNTALLPTPSSKCTGLTEKGRGFIENTTGNSTDKWWISGDQHRWKPTTELCCQEYMEDVPASEDHQVQRAEQRRRVSPGEHYDHFYLPILIWGKKEWPAADTTMTGVYGRRPSTHGMLKGQWPLSRVLNQHPWSPGCKVHERIWRHMSLDKRMLYLLIAQSSRLQPAHNLLSHSVITHEVQTLHFISRRSRTPATTGNHYWYSSIPVTKCRNIWP